MSVTSSRARRVVAASVRPRLVANRSCQAPSNGWMNGLLCAHAASLTLSPGLRISCRIRAQLTLGELSALSASAVVVWSSEVWAGEPRCEAAAAVVGGGVTHSAGPVMYTACPSGSKHVNACFSGPPALPVASTSVAGTPSAAAALWDRCTVTPAAVPGSQPGSAVKSKLRIVLARPSASPSDASRARSVEVVAAAPTCRAFAWVPNQSSSAADAAAAAPASRPSLPPLPPCAAAAPNAARASAAGTNNNPAFAVCRLLIISTGVVASDDPAAGRVRGTWRSTAASGADSTCMPATVL